jgi:hypothetical protein
MPAGQGLADRLRVWLALVVVLEHLGPDVARADRHTANAGGGMIKSDASGELEDRGLGGAVDGKVGLGPVRVD